MSAKPPDRKSQCRGGQDVRERPGCREPTGAERRRRRARFHADARKRRIPRKNFRSCPPHGFGLPALRKKVAIAMRFVLLAAFAVGLSCSSHEADNYARHTAIIDTLEELQKPEHGISGSSFYSSPRYTEIHRQNPTEISWFTTNWNWAKVDFSQFKGGVVEAIFLQSRAHETRLKELGFQYMAGDFDNQPIRSSHGILLPS